VSTHSLASNREATIASPPQTGKKETPSRLRPAGRRPMVRDLQRLSRAGAGEDRRGAKGEMGA